MARFCSSSLVGSRTSARAERLPSNKAVQLQAERFGIQPVSLHSPVLLIQLLRADHITTDQERAQLPLQRKTKPACFINSINFLSPALELGRPIQKRLFCKSLWLLGVASAFLHNHHVKILMHINPKLDRASAAIKLAAGSLV